MARKTGIEWATATWNPWMGCRKVSEGCRECYMFREQRRYGHSPTEIRRSKTKFNDPLKWDEPEVIFVCSWSDFFLEEVPWEWRAEAWNIIEQTPHHTYLLLTKRPTNIRANLPTDWEPCGATKYRNVWLGVSVELQKYVHRIDQLLAIPAWRYFVSLEPMLGPIDIEYHLGDDMTRVLGFPTLDWVIVGGESMSRRVMKPEWAMDVRDQCVAAGVSYFFKQWGGMKRVKEGIGLKKDESWGGRRLDGKIWDEIPDR